MNDVTYFPVFTPSSDVPVFPPILYPFTWAFLPVPSATTLSIMLSIFLDVSSDITLSFFTTSTSVTSPVSLSIICFTTLGFIYVPPLAIVETIVIICIGVTSNLWPNAIVPSSTGPTFFSAKNIPVASPGKSIPVLLKNPYFLRYS